MKKILPIIIIILSIILFNGCSAPRLKWVEVQDRFDAHHHETINSIFYMGSDTSDHFLFHSVLAMHRTVYRVSKSELTIKNEFPYTDDKDLWHRYQMPIRLTYIKLVM